ncbi:MAG: putative colanic acid biosynthesis acetyltransferase [Bacteroidales bacterium]|nr:putative colanic acid biosynthesis acetyltransferase [Bacteroidales bacterium]
MSNELLIGKDYKNNLSIKNKMGRLIWNICYWILFRPFPTRLFKPWRRYILKQFGAKVGKNSTIQASAKIWAPWNLIIGNNSCVSKGVNLYNTGPILIGDNVIISERVFICPGSHDISNPNFPMIPSTVKIENKVWIAAEAFIGPRVSIGEGAVVGARAAVFKDVEPWSVVGGNPAVFLKKRVIKEQWIH